MWLPAVLKKHLRALPQWSPIALCQPQSVVQVRLVTAGATTDVTRASVVAALRPLTLAVSSVGRTASPVYGSNDHATLVFTDLQTRRTVGTLKIRLVSALQLDDGVSLDLFEVSEGTHHCLRWPYRSWNRWLQMRNTRKKVDPSNFTMTPEAIQQLMIFYTCPRPVVLVSVDDGKHSNLFPMDLIGPVSEHRFTLALRTTSPSIATMKATRRVVLSDAPAHLTPVIYKLGAHHKKITIDWAELPFGSNRSETFSLPYPQVALRVRELEILRHESIGSHTFFITRVVSERSYHEGPQLFHTNGNYQFFRSQFGQGFPPAP